MALKQPVSARNRFRFTKGFYHPIFNAAACCPSRRDWRRWVDATRQQAGQDTMWPRLKYVRIPRYEGDGMSSVFPGEKLPPLDKMPGHVLHGCGISPLVMVVGGLMMKVLLTATGGILNA